MFLGAHFSNSTVDSDFCENICGLVDFAKKLARVDGFADHYPLPSYIVVVQSQCQRSVFKQKFKENQLTQVLEKLETH